MPDPWYYLNPSGKVAFSMDEGDTLCLPSGKLIPYQDAWEEVQDDLQGKLTPTQAKTLGAMQKAAEERSRLTGIDKIADDLVTRGKAERKKARYAEPKPVYPKISESALVVTSDPDD